MIFLNKIKKFIIGHKFITAIIAVVVIGGGYYWYQSANKVQAPTKYVLGTVQKETLITSISGSGQVSASNQVDIKAQASGDAIVVNVVQGQSVRAGALLVQLSATDAQKAVRDAQANLDSAKLSLAKLQQPADQLSLTQSENALTSAQQAKIKDQDDLNKAYEDAFTNISNAFLDLPTVVTGIQDILYKNTYNVSQSNLSYYNDAAKQYDANVSVYRDNAASSYQTSRTAYDKNFLSYKTASRSDSETAIEALLNETYNTAKLISDSVKNTDNFLSFVKDRLTEHNDNLPSQLATHQASITTYTSKANSNLASLLGSITTIRDAKDALASDDLSIKEKTESLAKLKAGTDALDIQSQELAIKQKENALLDAREKLANYSVRAPFDGVIAKINVAKGDSVSSAGAVATIITNQRIAIISVNEVDAAKIKIGQQTALTFDAIDGLEITGHVAQVDVTGTVTQGVVNYNVQIVLDMQDNRIKPGMSAAASIIVDAKPDVLAVPNSAVKTQGNQHYVLVADSATSRPVAGSASQITLTALPQSQIVEIGAANDSITQIISGLKEGDTIIVQTIAGSTTSSPAAAQGSSFRIPGITGGAGAANRAIRAD